MARASSGPSNEDSDGIAPDAVSLLRRDHRLAEELFAEFERSAPQQLDPLARRICKMLRVHAKIEEELFYPAVSRALTQEPELVEQARRAHERCEQAIVRVESMTSEHPSFRDEMATLAKCVTEHVASEEHDMFPKVSGTDIDLTALGIALIERRDTLLDVLGLHGDDEEGAANQRETRPEQGR